MDDILPLLIGGLVLFLYSISALSNVMKGLFSNRAKLVIAKYTKNVFSSLLVGTTMTILLGSSSAVIILAIVFINSKTLTFKQAIGIILGANIGTTFSSQIIALDIGKYSIFLLIIGLAFDIFASKPEIKRYGRVALYFGMLFFGLFLMEVSVMPLRESAAFEEWVKRVNESYVQGTLIGGLITLIIQSSSGTVGIAIVLGKQNLITVAGGIAIMLGAELGTCSDTLIATVRGSRQAIKAGLFHLSFNFFTICVGLLIFIPFVNFIVNISGNVDIGKQIANAHMMFNILGVLVALPFVGLAEKTLNRMLPDRAEAEDAAPDQ